MSNPFKPTLLGFVVPGRREVEEGIERGNLPQIHRTKKGAPVKRRPPLKTGLLDL